MSDYRFEITRTALGEAFEFRGPGLGYYGTYLSVHLVQGKHEADTIVHLLQKAYEAGRQAKAEELRTVLGVHKDPEEAERLMAQKYKGPAECVPSAPFEAPPGTLVDDPTVGEVQYVQKCTARESRGYQCELPHDHEGPHACPEALAKWLSEWWA